jgi:hypothetical protein
MDEKKLAKKAIEDEKLLSELLEKILSKKDEIRSHSFKTLMIISEQYPKKLYSKWDYFADMLDSENHYHRYMAINLIANLAKVDIKNEFNQIFDKYFCNIGGKRTMVAGQAALNSGKIAKVKPELRSNITNRLLNIDKIHQGKQTELIKAYAVDAFDEYFEVSSDQEKILAFVNAQLNSESPKTRKKAEEFLKKRKK